MKTIAAVTLLIVAAVCIGCDDDATVLSTSNPGITQTDSEAALAALWLSGELTAPDELYQTIHDDLAAIRSAFADLDTITSVRYHARWVPSRWDEARRACEAYRYGGS
jgi:hypothetical protein